jgi:glutaminyl-peptide cyclotransferase
LPRLPGWLPYILILAGIALLIIGFGVWFTARPAGSTAVTFSTPTFAAPASPTLPPTPLPRTATPLNSPPPTLEAISPLPTPILTSTSPVTSALVSDSALRFQGDLAYQYVLAQSAIGPRPTGSEAGWTTGDYIMTELEKMGWITETQEFLFQGVKGRNIVGRRGSGPIIIVGAHYDTRPAADNDPDPAKRSEWIEGANDGASGVAVLLELARVLEADKLKHEVWLAFFDAEDRGRLDGWPFSVGARQMAEKLTGAPQAVVVVDMIGDADQNIYLEQNSTPDLSDEIWAVAGELGYEAYIIPQLKHTIIDDHIPFLERGFPAVDIIDFDYPYWHTTADTADKVAPESLERVGRTLEVWLEEKQ